MNFFCMLKTIFYSLTALVLKILFLPLENKIHILAPPCNILYVYSVIYSAAQRLANFAYAYHTQATAYAFVVIRV